MRTLIAALLLSTLLVSCKHEIYVEPPVVPSVLIYTPNTLTSTTGTASSSAIPTIAGTKPVTYTLVSSPATAAITIDSLGVISTTNALAAGTFKLSITAANAAGSVVFQDVFTVVNIQTISFATHIKPMMQTKCGPCHIYATGALTNYTNYNNAKTNINSVLDRITRSETSVGYMPTGKPPLTTAEVALITQWKNQSFPQ